MEIIISLIALVLIITIFDYASAKSWQQASSSNRNEIVFEHRNKSYGAYTLRKEYDKRMMIIIFSLLGSIALLYTAWMIYKSIPEVKPPAPPVDTTQMTVPAPPAEDEIPPPPPPPEDDIPPPVEETVAFIAPVVTDDPEQETEIIIPPDDVKAADKTEKGVGDGFEEYGEPPVDDPDEPDIVPEKEDEVYTFVQEDAEFPGGYSSMMAFIQNNLTYPEIAMQNEVQGICYLKFIVELNGTISDIKVTKGVPDCLDCDKAAIKTVKSMPNWKPAKNDGKIVRQNCTMKINFVMN